MILRIFVGWMTRFGVAIDWDMEATFVSRPNRFLALVKIPGEKMAVEAHVHDPGRLKEILYEGNKLLVRKARSTDRKTRWDVIAGRVENNWILINSSFHRKISQDLLMDSSLNPFGDHSSLKPEVMVGNSRLDYLIIDKNGMELYVEVKGCSLTIDGRATFPDAPTIRGKRHLEELIDIRKRGVRSGILILVLGPPAKCFTPNFDTDPEFSRTFLEALRCGVEVHTIRFEISNKKLMYQGPIPVCPEILSDQ